MFGEVRGPEVLTNFCR